MYFEHFIQVGKNITSLQSQKKQITLNLKNFLFKEEMFSRPSYKSALFSLQIYSCVCVCVCVSARENERENTERVCVCVCTCVKICENLCI